MNSYSYPAIIYKQRDSAEQLFCVCTARVGDVQTWARVDRLTPQNMTGVQRTRKDARVDAIESFLKVDDRNTIPTSIVIALPKSSVAIEGADIATIGRQPVSVTLKIQTTATEPQPGLIIDGQHRTYGIAQFDPATPVNLVILIGPGDDEIAFQFVVINNKVSKVSPEHIKALKLGYSDVNLDARLTKSASMKSSGAPAYLESIDTQDDSPFKGRLKWPRNETDPKRAIPLNAFEMSLAYIAAKKIDQMGADGPSPDFIVRFFLEMWKTVHAQWHAIWNDPCSKLTGKIGIVCMTEYLVDTMIFWAMVPNQDPSQSLDLTDLNQVAKVTESILGQQEMAFWTSEWSDTSLDTKSGREAVVDALQKIQQNKTIKKQEWNTGIRLMSGKKEE